MSFSDLKDQRPVADQLRRSLQRGRLAHAYLLTGPRGGGKDTMARTLAKALNCEEKEHDSCDRCDSCRRIDAMIHPDIYWVRPESKGRRIKVEQIREFEKAVNLRANSARVKVGVIVDADCMSEEASNAFLKTLEEPPTQTIILLLSAEPQRLLPTILSRCLKLSFGQASQRVVSPYRDQLLPLLMKFSASGNEKIVNTYRLLADLTKILGTIRAETRTRVEAEANLDRYEELDPKTREKLEEQMEARIEGEYRSAREQVVEEIYHWFGDVLLCVAEADESLLEHPDQLPAVKRAAGSLTYAQASTNLDAIEQIRDSLNRHIAEPFAFEVGLLKLTA